MALMSPSELDALLKKLDLRKSGVDYVNYVRDHPPERRVKATGRRNSVVRYASKRMGRTIQAESWTVEGVFVLECEYDIANVHEYWDQSKSVFVEGTRSNGRHHRGPYTADYLVIKPNGIFAYELKSTSDLLELVSKRPLDWTNVDGVFEYKPATLAFAELGIKHIVIPSRDLNQVRAENLRILLQARYHHIDYSDSAIAKACIKLVHREQAIRLSDVCESLNIVDMTPIFQLIASAQLFAELERHSLADPYGAWICDSEKSVILIGDAEERYFPELRSGESVTLDDVVTPSEAIYITNCCLQLEGLEVPIDDKLSKRSLSRKRKILEASGGDIRKLRRKYHLCGNRTEQINQDHEEFIKQQIKLHYETVKAPCPHGAWILYKANLKDDEKRSKIGLPISYNPFKERVNRRPAEKAAFSRGGRRAANAVAQPSAAETKGMWPTRAFQRDHIDHYLLDVYVPIARTADRVFTARPWLTLMRDDYSNANAASSIGFLPPSRRACAKVIRDCVRRHGRHPECVVVDKGSDFMSGYFEQLLARMRCHKQERPPEAPRFGGSLESAFGSFKKFITSHLPGNTNNSIRGRSVSPSHKGEAHAVVSIQTIVELVEQYFFTYHNGNALAAAMTAPGILLSEGLERISCSGLPMEYDQKFIITSAIEAPEKQYKIDPSRGIRIYDRWYWSPKLALINDPYARDVLVEPWDDTISYVPVDEEWAICYSARSSRQRQLDSITRLLESTCRLEAREALRLVKEHQDDELGKLLKQTFTFVERDSAMAQSSYDTPGDQEDDKSVLPLPAADVKPFELYFNDSP